MIGNLVTSTWLKANINLPDLILLDASQYSNSNNSLEENRIQIPHSISFDLKVFSEVNSPYPNTLPTTQHFEQKAQALGINNSSTIVVYDSEGIYTSPRVWWLFKTMGHQNVAVLDGGLPAWINNGFETVAILTTKTLKRGNFTANFNHKLVRTFKDITTNLKTQEELVIDSRSHDRFFAIVPEPRKGLRGGHIPNSVNIPFELVLENGHLKTNEELTKIFNQFNLANKTLTFTCGSGVTACILYLASEQILENTKAIYDGSWTEWAQLSDL
jgi:thiosulfate/3-mercaptopyruvate sulfurtransferase